MVAAYNSPNGCILAPSIEAKTYGIKTGMRVKEARVFYPNLIVLKPDPWKYRNIHLKLRKLLSGYTNDFLPKSIDEFVLNLEGYPALSRKSPDHKLKNFKTCLESKARRCHGRETVGDSLDKSIYMVGREIKKRIRREIGDWITVSIGVSTNRYLAKIASNLKKPDGLEEINKDNYKDIYSKLKLTDLSYIKSRNAARLSAFGINTVLDFYNADVKTLKSAFHSVTGYYWYLRLHGWEIDKVEFGRRSYGNSYSLPKPYKDLKELAPILSKLVTKMSTRLRNAGYQTSGIHLAVAYKDGSFWHKGRGLSRNIFLNSDIYKEEYKLLSISPRKPVRNLAVSVFNITKKTSLQLQLFEDIEKRKRLSDSQDKTNKRWGDFVLIPGRMLMPKSMNLKSEVVPDRIAFGNIKELEEFTLKSKDV